MAVDEHVVESLLALARTGRLDELVVDDLRQSDLAELDWAGGPTHVVHVGEALRRVPSGEVEYLVIRAPSGEPVAKAGIDYTKRDDAGAVWQLATHPRLQSLGLATRLIEAAAARARAIGRPWVVLAVEDDNPRARSLYERLGFSAFGREETSWEQEDEHGRPGLHETTVTLLRRPV